jgi:hypothetical protein
MARSASGSFTVEFQPRQSLSDKQFWADGINIFPRHLEPLECSSRPNTGALVSPRYEGDLLSLG